MSEKDITITDLNNQIRSLKEKDSENDIYIEYLKKAKEDYQKLTQNKQIELENEKNEVDIISQDLNLNEEELKKKEKSNLDLKRHLEIKKSELEKYIRQKQNLEIEFEKERERNHDLIFSVNEAIKYKNENENEISIKKFKEFKEASLNKMDNIENEIELIENKFVDMEIKIEEIIESSDKFKKVNSLKNSNTNNKSKANFRVFNYDIKQYMDDLKSLNFYIKKSIRNMSFKFDDWKFRLETLSNDNES